jgi:hypothetical protein
MTAFHKVNNQTIDCYPNNFKLNILIISYSASRPVKFAIEAGIGPVIELSESQL